MLNALALDLGTRTGYTYFDPHEGLVCSAWKLASPKEIKSWGESRLSRRCDPRIDRLFDLVSTLHSKHLFDVIIFEDVCFASSTYQVQLWSALRAAVWLCGVPGKLPYFEAVPVGTLKKFATGSGSADKSQMLAAAQKQKLLDNFDGLGDDEIDSLHLFFWAQKNLSRIKIQ